MYLAKRFEAKGMAEWKGPPAFNKRSASFDAKFDDDKVIMNVNVDGQKFVCKASKGVETKGHTNIVELKGLVELNGETVAKGAIGIHSRQDVCE
jgi:hypothetical protein